MKNSLDAGFFSKLKKQYSGYDAERRVIIKISGDALTRAKQAIFSFHRKEAPKGGELLKEAETLLLEAAKKFKSQPELATEGSYRAALEEFVEARLFQMFLEEKTLGAVTLPGVDEDVYLGGLFDLTGELVRYAVLSATEKNKKEVLRASAALDDIVREIISMNITGSLRPKYDQMKQSLRKMEEIKYDLSLRE